MRGTGTSSRMGCPISFLLRVCPAPGAATAPRRSASSAAANRPNDDAPPVGRWDFELLVGERQGGLLIGSLHVPEHSRTGAAEAVDEPLNRLGRLTGSFSCAHNSKM
jgi:hypothetical protein